MSDPDLISCCWVVLVASDTVMACAGLGVVAAGADVHARHQDISGVAAGRRCVAGGAIEHAMGMMSEACMLQPARGHVGRFVDRQGLGPGSPGVVGSADVAQGAPTAAIEQECLRPGQLFVDEAVRIPDARGLRTG